MSEPFSAVPEWVHVWRWYRTTHPEDPRAFPQQGQWSPAEMLDYDAVRAEWLEARSPSMSFAEVVAEAEKARVL